MKDHEQQEWLNEHEAKHSIMCAVKASAFFFVMFLVIGLMVCPT